MEKVRLSSFFTMKTSINQQSNISGNYIPICGFLMDQIIPMAQLIFPQINGALNGKIIE